MTREAAIVWGHWATLVVCFLSGVGILAFAPTDSEITVAMMTLLGATVGNVLKNIGTIVDYLFGSSKEAEGPSSDST